jgi:hypothetical protein
MTMSTCNTGAGAGGAKRQTLAGCEEWPEFVQYRSFVEQGYDTTSPTTSVPSMASVPSMVIGRYY